jgi:hypothetical protein
MGRLKEHIPGYEKGAGNTFATTSEHLSVARLRAEQLALHFTADTDPQPFIGVAELVSLLIGLRA